MPSKLRLAVAGAIAVAASACAIPADDTEGAATIVISPEGDHVLSIDPELHREREEARAMPDRPAITPDEVLTAVAAAPLVIVARPVASELILRDVLVEGQREERAIWIAEVDLARLLAGAAPAARLTVEMPASSDRARLDPGKDVLLSLYPTDDGAAFRVDHSMPIGAGGEVPALARGLDAIDADLEVFHAR
jgi:hypothetical protein